eukprot:2524557-Prymnesium_polylepis.1
MLFPLLLTGVVLAGSTRGEDAAAERSVSGGAVYLPRGHACARPNFTSATPAHTVQMGRP